MRIKVHSKICARYISIRIQAFGFQWNYPNLHNYSTVQIQKDLPKHIIEKNIRTLLWTEENWEGESLAYTTIWLALIPNFYTNTSCQVELQYQWFSKFHATIKLYRQWSTLFFCTWKRGVHEMNFISSVKHAWFKHQLAYLDLYFEVWNKHCYFPQTSWP